MHEAVRAAVQKYVDGCAAADPERVRDAFDEHAVMWGYLGPDYVTMSGADFAAGVVQCSTRRGFSAPTSATSSV
jgi:hypothetical protein